MRGALSYNEHKVREGNAELLLASKFGADINELGFTQKLKRFEVLNSNSTRITNNTVHISLNFPPEETLDTETLQNISLEYMQRLGFAGQPYLVYRHDDTSHPHVHIITTPILQNGKSINLHNIAKLKSEPARILIEEEFSLIKAQDKKLNVFEQIAPATINTAYYGKEETKKTISNIVNTVVQKYKFTSLDELNAILRQYNIIADRGAEGTKMYNNKGLVFSIIDEDGYKLGIPIKASDILSKPTLPTLENKFRLNEKNKIAARPFVNKRISYILSKSNSVQGFMAALRNKNISSAIEYGKNNSIQQVSFIDENTKTVFTSNELGIELNNMLNKIRYPEQTKPILKSESEKSFLNEKQEKPVDISDSIGLLKDLLTTESDQFYLSPEQFRKKRKKKKRK